MEIGPLVQAFLLLLLAGLPLLTTGEETLEEVFGEAEDRSPLYVSAAVSLVLVAGATWAVSAWAGLDPRALGWTVGGLAAGLGWAAAVTAAGLASVAAVTPLVRRLGWKESRAVFFLLPRGRREKRMFVLLALAAAVCEEYVYRGFAFHVAEAWSGAGWAAVVVTSASFGLAHGYQRAAGVLRATLLGVLLAVPVAATGSLFPAVVAHFWINAVIGLGGWRWLAPDVRRPADGPDGSGDRAEREDRSGRREDRDAGPRDDEGARSGSV